MKDDEHRRKVPGERTGQVTLDPGASADTPVRNQRPAGSCPDRTRPSPARCRPSPGEEVTSHQLGVQEIALAAKHPAQRRELAADAPVLPCFIVAGADRFPEFIAAVLLLHLCRMKLLRCEYLPALLVIRVSMNNAADVPNPVEELVFRVKYLC